ncbi:MAG: TIGR03564 family F420-dependent LLM class oxidoreductase [Sporichthyaceae bacterium]
MRIAINLGGDVLAAPLSPRHVVEQAVAAETAGFSSAWTAHFLRGSDALATVAAAAARTERIELGVGVVPIHARHPVALASEAATIAALSDGRFTLGIGVSHKPAIEAIGLSYDSPAAYLREYLEVLMPLLETGTATHSGPNFRVDTAVSVVGAVRPSVVVGALGPRMLAAAAELADGTITWMAGPRGIADHIAPTLGAAAAKAGRPAPRVIVGLPVALDDDEAAARATAEKTFARYNTLQNYRRQMEREGAASVGYVVACGSEKAITARFDSLRDAGATEIWAVPYPVGADAAASTERTQAFLASLARRA